MVQISIFVFFVKHLPSSRQSVVFVVASPFTRKGLQAAKNGFRTNFSYSIANTRLQKNNIPRSRFAFYLHGESGEGETAPETVLIYGREGGDVLKTLIILMTSRIFILMILMKVMILMDQTFSQWSDWWALCQGGSSLGLREEGRWEVQVRERRVGAG